MINVPTTDLVNEVVGIGNCSGQKIDKFEEFGLTPAPASKVGAPLIGEGVFMISGRSVSLRRRFKPQNL